jgi:alpha-mannosidase
MHPSPPGNFKNLDNLLDIPEIKRHNFWRGGIVTISGWKPFHVRFNLAPARTGSLNAVAAKGQTIHLPPGHYNRVFLLAASAEGDQKAAFEIGNRKVERTIQDWGGFIGQWDDRQGSSKDASQDSFGTMTGLKPGYIKRADLAWYCDHHHDASGKNVAYAYSYLFGYAIDLPSDARTLVLPDNDQIRILAISVADENPSARPVQPLYDVLPSPNARPSDFAVSASSASVSAPQGGSGNN